MGFVPPPYPYDRLDELKELAASHEGGSVNLSLGTPCETPPPFVVEAMANSGDAHTYPPSIGTHAFRDAAASWLNRLVGSDITADQVRATIGLKEFVAGLPHLLKLRTPERDTILYPAVSYPSYEMGAALGGCRAVPVPVDDAWRIDLSVIDPADAARALCLWVNSPGNPAGAIDDLAAAAAWGRANDVLVVADECYSSFTWDRRPQSIVTSGLEGVLAVHSLSKRSNMAGARAGFYVGDPAIVNYLGEVRKHGGFMQPGPVQAAAVAALGDEAHVDGQRELYYARLVLMQKVLAEMGSAAPLPEGGFFLWAPAPAGDAWAFARRLASEAGAVVIPGEFYGQQGAGHVRVAMVQPDERIHLVAGRVGVTA